MLRKMALLRFPGIAPPLEREKVNGLSPCMYMYLEKAVTP